MDDTKNTQEKRTGSPNLCFRAPPIVKKQIEALRKEWGENLTQAIHRAIAQAYDREFDKRRK